MGSSFVVDWQAQILREIEGGLPQAEVARTYAILIGTLGNKADWPRINAAIKGRWKGQTALNRVKEMAWAHMRKEAADGR